jgi:hypothetical protein
MINKGVQPIGSGLLRKGFYVSPDPNDPGFFARKAAHLGDEIIIQFSMSPTKARKNKIRVHFYKGKKEIETYFNLFTPVAINRLRMDTIYVHPNIPAANKKEIIDKIRDAQRSAQYKRLNSSNSNSNS